MDGWMEGWMDGWIGGWMDGWVDGWMGGWMHTCMMNIWKEERMTLEAQFVPFVIPGNQPQRPESSTM